MKDNQIFVFTLHLSAESESVLEFITLFSLIPTGEASRNWSFSTGEGKSSSGPAANSMFQVACCQADPCPAPSHHAWAKGGRMFQNRTHQLPLSSLSGSSARHWAPVLNRGLDMVARLENCQGLTQPGCWFCKPLCNTAELGSQAP